MKRNSTALCIAVAVALILVCAVPAALAKDNGPIKIGFMAPYVGPLAKSGIDMDHGFRLALDEAGYKVAGRQIQLIAADDEGKPELGPTKARMLIEKDHVNMIAGLAHSGVALSIRDLVVEHKIPLIITTAGEPSLTTGKLKSPYIFRTCAYAMLRDRPAGWYAYHKLGMKRMVLIAPDYVAGHEMAEGFKQYFTASGGKIVDEIYAPIDTNDFSPYLTKIAANAKSIDGVWSFYPPGAGIRLVNQYQEYGLKKSVPLFIVGEMTDASILPAMKEAALGVKSYSDWTETMPNPENQAFVKAYRAKYKEYPSVYAERGYVGAKAIMLALQAVKGDVENKDAFLAALRKVKFNAPHGPFRFGADQQVMVPVYLREVRKTDAGYLNYTIGTIATDVTEDWTPPKK